MNSTRPAPPPATRSPRTPAAPRRLLTALAIALAAPAIGAASAQAVGTVTYPTAGGVMTIAGDAGNNGPLLSYDGAVSEDTTRVKVAFFEGSTAPATCAPTWEDDVWSCPRPSSIVVQLGAGDDTLGVYEGSETPFTVPIEAHGGPGNDVLDGGSGNDVFYGEDGNDTLTGRGGNDRLYGQGGNDILNGDFGTSNPGGNDLLDGGDGDDQFEKYVGYGSPASLAGSDTYIGGPGNDSFSYFNRSGAVNISLDGVANDGMPGEADNIHPDIEEVGGSDGNDVIVGSPGDNHLWGGDGNDVIHGLAGNDRLSGDNGDDTIDGGPGNDELAGGCMSDTLIGGPGIDSFYSDAAPFSTCGASLRSPLDRIEAADGERDALIFCQELGDQAGDVANVDATDPVSKSGAGACATVNVAPVPGGGGGGGGGDPVGPPGGGGTTTVPLKGKKRATLGKTLVLLTGTGKKGQAAKQGISLKKKRLTLGTLRATKQTKTVVTATIRRRGRTITLGRTTITVKAGTTRTLTVKLGSKALRALKGLKKASVATSFKVGKKTYRKTFRVTVSKK